MGTHCCQSACSSARGLGTSLQLEVLWPWPEGGRWVVSSACSAPCHGVAMNVPPVREYPPFPGMTLSPTQRGFHKLPPGPSAQPSRTWGPERAADSAPSAGASSRWGEPPAAEARPRPRPPCLPPPMLASAPTVGYAGLPGSQLLARGMGLDRCHPAPHPAPCRHPQSPPLLYARCC